MLWCYQGRGSSTGTVLSLIRFPYINEHATNRLAFQTVSEVLIPKEVAETETVGDTAQKVPVGDVPCTKTSKGDEVDKQETINIAPKQAPQDNGRSNLAEATAEPLTELTLNHQISFFIK